MIDGELRSMRRPDPGDWPDSPSIPTRSQAYLQALRPATQHRSRDVELRPWVETP